METETESCETPIWMAQLIENNKNKNCRSVSSVVRILEEGFHWHKGKEFLEEQN